MRRGLHADPDIGHAACYISSDRRMREFIALVAFDIERRDIRARQHQFQQHPRT
ncbi:hypothetical protein D3C73_1383080 [compost metagenome]